MQLSICGLQNSHQVIFIFLVASFTLISSLFSEGAEITLEEAADVLDIVGKSNNIFLQTRTALEILREEQDNHSIITMSQKIDHLLDGGIPICKVTEISGVAGVGKTQLW